MANEPPYLVGEILKAYDANGVGVTGKGQTIAILIDTFPNDNDLTAIWKANGVNTDLTRIKKIKVGGGHLPAPEGEETLDASWSSGIAPDATIKIYATGSLRFTALDQALDRIVADASNDPSMRQVSISLGLPPRHTSTLPTPAVCAQGDAVDLKLAPEKVTVRADDPATRDSQDQIVC